MAGGAWNSKVSGRSYSHSGKPPALEDVAAIVVEIGVEFAMRDDFEWAETKLLNISTMTPPSSCRICCISAYIACALGIVGLGAGGVQQIVELRRCSRTYRSTRRRRHRRW